MGALLQYISASALSVTLGGNSGVAPFLTLLIVGIIERADPTLLNMEDWVSKAVASWPSIAVLGALTIVEFVAKCVPCVDAVYESSMAFVAPILSVFGSVSAFGLFNDSFPAVAAAADFRNIHQLLPLRLLHHPRRSLA